MLTQRFKFTFQARIFWAVLTWVVVALILRQLFYAKVAWVFVYSLTTPESWAAGMAVALLAPWKVAKSFILTIVFWTVVQIIIQALVEAGLVHTSTTVVVLFSLAVALILMTITNRVVKIKGRVKSPYKHFDSTRAVKTPPPFKVVHPEPGPALEPDISDPRGRGQGNYPQAKSKWWPFW